MKLRAAFFLRLLGSACTALFVALTVAAVASGFPVGSYISGPYTLKFEPNGSFRVIKSGVALVEGTYRVNGDQLQITDKRGPFACTGKGLATGTYTWSVETGTLRFSKVQDNCSDRAQSFTEPWKKQ